MPWDNGPSRTSTTAWKTTRTRIIERDSHQCTATRQDLARCPETTNLEVDHIIRPELGGTDDDSNLTTLCHWHHNRKTQAEAAASRTTRSIMRPPEVHPALRTRAKPEPPAPF